MKWSSCPAHTGLKGFFHLYLQINTGIKMQYMLINAELEYLDIVTVDSVVT